jgi:hypothetical protein
MGLMAASAIWPATAADRNGRAKPIAYPETGGHSRHLRERHEWLRAIAAVLAAALPAWSRARAPSPVQMSPSRLCYAACGGRSAPPLRSRWIRSRLWT